MTPGRASYQMRGKAALLGAGAIFLLAQLAAGWLLDCHGLAVRFPSAARVLAAAPRGRRPHVVLLGSSRFQSLDGPEATRLLRRDCPAAGPVEVYNAAVPGGDPIAQDYVLQCLLSQGARPRLALVEVSPDTVNRYNQMFSLHIHRQLAWWDLPACWADICLSGEVKKLLAARLVPLYVHRRELLRLAARAAADFFTPPKPEVATAPPEGSTATAPLSWEELLRIDVPPLPAATVELWRAGAETTRKRFRHYQPGGTTAAALERLLDRCRSHGIDVILIGVPNASFYRQNFTPEIDSAYSSYLARLSREHGCRFVDYRDAAPDQLFGDFVHLTSAGGKYFTRRLVREVLSPYWRERTAPQTVVVTADR